MTSPPFPTLPTNSLVALGRRLAVARRARKMSQRDLAFLSGVGANTIVSLEKGHPGVAIGTLARVLDAMDLLSEMDHLMQTRRDPALAQYALNHLGACPTFEQGQPQAALAPGLVAVRTLSLKAQE